MGEGPEEELDGEKYIHSSKRSGSRKIRWDIGIRIAQDHNKTTKRRKTDNNNKKRIMKRNRKCNQKRSIGVK